MDSEVAEATGDTVPFYPEPILVNLEGGRYIGPIFPASLAKLVAGRRLEGGGAPKRGGSGRNKKPLPKVAATG